MSLNDFLIKFSFNRFLDVEFLIKISFFRSLVLQEIYTLSMHLLLF